MKHNHNTLASISRPWAIQVSGQPFVYFNYNPVGGKTRVEYATAVARHGSTIHYIYDMLGRRLTYFEGELSESYTYDATSDIFYYHMNHLGSTAYVTDQNQNITQGFLYAPFGEITTEYAPLWQNSTLPKYAFNAKELDEETGMYYYEARYYKPPVFTSRDPMFEKYFWMTPYAYCVNNPVKYVDPDGEEYGDYYNWNGKYLGWDGNDNDDVHFVSDKSSINKIKRNKKQGIYTSITEVTIDVSTNLTVLKNVLDVHDRTIKNGNTREEATYLTSTGPYYAQGPSINETSFDQNPTVTVTYDGDLDITIHSHYPIRFNEDRSIFKTFSALRSSPKDRTVKANLNVITGTLGDAKYVNFNGNGQIMYPEYGAAFYNSNWELKGSITIEKLKKVVNNKAN